MDTFAAYTAMRLRLQQADRQVDRILLRITDDTVTADWLRGGIWNNAFEVWMDTMQLLWDLTDPAEDVTLNTYNLGPGVDVAAMQAAMTERDRPKMIDFWRVDMENAALAVPSSLGALRTSMIAVRDWVIANYGTVTTADGVSVDPATGEAVWEAIPKAQLAALETLLNDTKAKLAPLVN